MKFKENANIGDHLQRLAAELEYVMEDVESYDDLTDREKQIWTRESFEEIFE